MFRPEPDDFERELRRFDRGTLAVYIRWCWFRELRDAAEELRLVAGMRDLISLDVANDVMEQAGYDMKAASQRGDRVAFFAADRAFTRAMRSWRRLLQRIYPERAGGGQ